MFTARKKAPKRVAREEPQAKNNDEEDDGPVVRRPTAVPKTKSKLRIAFEPEEDASTDSGATPSATRPRIGPSNASQSIIRTTIDRDVERPSYSRSALDELRNSTPTTPKDLTSGPPTPDDTAAAVSALDITSKFGPSRPHSTTSIIPSAAEIQEKKERRARLAKQQGADDFIPLEDYDSDGEFKPQRMQLDRYQQPVTSAKDTRLVHEDEDLLEGYEDFIDDPGHRLTTVSLAHKTQSTQNRDQIRSIISRAEGNPTSASSSDDGNSSDSSAERTHAYTSAQTHRGMDGLAIHAQHTLESTRPRQPHIITPIPKLSVSLTRLRDAASAIELEKAKIERRRAVVQREKAEIKSSQEHIQRSLEEAGRELEELKTRAEGGDGTILGGAATSSVSNGALDSRSRGLDSLGAMTPS